MAFDERGQGVEGGSFCDVSAPGRGGWGFWGEGPDEHLAPGIKEDGQAERDREETDDGEIRDVAYLHLCQSRRTSPGLG